MERGRSGSRAGWRIAQAFGTCVNDTDFRECGLQELRVRGDARGSLIAIEGGVDVPFPIARVYYIFDTKPGVERGFHAHHDLLQWLICVSGSCVVVLDDGGRREEFALNRPDLALQIGPMIWREMRDFSPGAVLMVLASAHYAETDYVRDYAEFVSLASEAKR